MRIHLVDRQTQMRVSKTALRALARHAFVVRPLPYDDVNLVLVDDAEVRRLNRTYRGIDRATDVLSFDLRDDNPPPVPRTGEVVVSTETLLRAAARHRVTPAEELARLVIHGILHLQGFDHQRPAERRAMRRQEHDLLTRTRTEQLRRLVAKSG